MDENKTKIQNIKIKTITKILYIQTEYVEACYPKKIQKKSLKNHKNK